MVKIIALLAMAVMATSAVLVDARDQSAAAMVADIYRTCVQDFQFGCAKPKALAWLSDVAARDIIRLTNDLTIVRTADEQPLPVAVTGRGGDRHAELFYRIESFMATHSLRVGVPEILRAEETRAFIPDTFLTGGLAQDLEVPLAEGNSVEGRGFVKKVMIPFLLGLKFKTTVMVPLMLALIALKSWKAMTLGLLSLVLAGAIVIFKFAKTKVVNYEVVHYPHPPSTPHHHHHVEHHVDHPPPGWVDNASHGWGRDMDAQQMAYGRQ